MIVDTLFIFFDDHIYYILGACLALYIIYSYFDTKIKKLDSSLIEALNSIAQSLDANNSIEAAIFSVSKDKSNASSKLFWKIIEETRKGHSFEESLQIVSKSTKSATFAYVCDIIYLSQRSGGNVADSLKKLSENLWEIDHLQESIQSKASGPITTLKFLGIIIIPVLYYFLAAILTQGPVAVDITWHLKVYLGLVAIAVTFTDFFLFADLVDGVYLLPFSACFVALIILRIGPLLLTYFTGAG